MIRKVSGAELIVNKSVIAIFFVIVGGSIISYVFLSW